MAAAIHLCACDIDTLDDDDDDDDGKGDALAHGIVHLQPPLMETFHIIICNFEWYTIPTTYGASRLNEN